MLLGGEIRYVLHMLQLEWQTFLLLERMLLLFVSIQGLILSTVNIHAFEDVGALLDAHFHIDVLDGIGVRFILDRKQHAEIFTG